MSPKRLTIRVLTILGPGLLCLGLSGGCGDDSKTTGTQLQMSPEVKAEIDDMKSIQKELRAERQKQRAAGRGKGKPAD